MVDGDADGTPYAGVVELLLLATRDDVWPFIEAAYHPADLLDMPAGRALSLITAWLFQHVEQDGVRRALADVLGLGSPPLEGLPEDHPTWGLDPEFEAAAQRLGPMPERPPLIPGDPGYAERP